MILRWTYFLLPRLILGMLITIFLGYGVLLVYNEILFPNSSGSAQVLVLLTGIISFILGWNLWTAAGRLQVDHLLSSAETSIGIKDYEEAKNAFRRAQRIIRDSSHFPIASSQTENEAFVNRFADFCLRAKLNDVTALSVYAEYFTINRSDDTFAHKVIPIVIASKEVRPQHLNLLKMLLNLAPDSLELRDFLAATYLNHEIYNSDSIDILVKAIRDYSPMRPLGLKFLLPRMLEQRRQDAIAAEIYLESYNSGLEHRDLMTMLVRLNDQARYEGKSSEIIKAIDEALKSIPESEISEIRERARKERIDLISLGEKPSEVMEPQEEVTAVEDERMETKFGETAEIIKDIKTALEKIPPLIIKALILLWQGLVWLIKLIIDRWQIARWVLVAALGFVIVFGLIKAISVRPPQQVVTSLEVTSDQPFTIQIAAFKDKSRAEKFIRESNLTGLKPYISSSHGETVWHQVRLGHYDTIEQAKQAAQEMGLTNYFIANFSPGMYLE